MKFICKNCGTENDEGAQLCLSCGGALPAIGKFREEEVSEDPNPNLGRGFGRFRLVKIPCESCDRKIWETTKICPYCHREQIGKRKNWKVLLIILIGVLTFGFFSFRPMSSTHGPSDDDLVLLDRIENPKLIDPVRIGCKGHLNPRTNIWSKETDIEKATVDTSPKFNEKQMQDGATFELLYLAKYKVIKMGKSHRQRYFVKFINGPMAGHFGWIMEPLYE